MARRRGIGASVAAVIVVAACGGDTGPDAGVVVDTVDGVERLTYPSGRVDALEWSADTVAVIGDPLGSDEYVFGPVDEDDVAGGPGGAVVVVDRQGARVLEYGPGGRHRATYGRRGEGPGELAYPSGVAVGPGDTIWVNDLRNRRLTGFPRDGGDPRTAPYTRGDVFPGSRIAPDGDGFLQVVGAIGAPGEPIPEPLVRLDRSLEVRDTLWVPPAENIEVVQFEFGGRSIVYGLTQEFWPDFHWRALPGGAAVVADSADYVFRIVGPDGAVRRIVRRDPPARTTTADDREASRARELARAEEAGADGGAEAEARRRLAEQAAERMTFFDRIPRIVALQVDPRNRIWVGVSERTPGEVERIDLYDATGRLLGELRGLPMPDAFTGENRILIVRPDELDVPRVMVLRVEEADGSRG